MIGIYVDTTEALADFSVGKRVCSVDLPSNRGTVVPYSAYSLKADKAKWLHDRGELIVSWDDGAVSFVHFSGIRVLGPLEQLAEAAAEVEDD